MSPVDLGQGAVRGEEAVEVVIDATPFATLALPIPLNVTVPVTDAGLIVAVNVTAWPCTDGLGLLVKLVVVVALTSCARPAEVLAL